MAPQDSEQRPAPLVWDLPEPRARSRPALNRAGIARTAVEIADAEGEQAVTMRRVAAALGSSTPMSLYRYVGSRDGIVDLMLDQVFAEIDLSSTPTGDWRADLRTLAHRTRAAVRRHSWFGSLSHHRPLFGPSSLRYREWSLAAVDGLGLPASQMMSVASIVGGYAIAAARSEAEEASMRRRVGLATDLELRASVRPFIDRLAADPRYPLLGRWITEEQTVGADELFELGLNCLLDGIERRVLPIKPE